MTQLQILAIVLVIVYGVACRPSEMAAKSLDDRPSMGNPIELSESSYSPSHVNRFKRAVDQTAQSHNGVRYNGMTILLPEGEGFINNQLAANSSNKDKPDKKPVNRMARIHIRIG
uniref:Uncharacterized protein n=1 Tax=Daphnia galeata TaxID=27404 RepID=A0A8J2S7R1_9CRUS|nr:unnamed protein product [Daphnia galeata]